MRKKKTNSVSEPRAFLLRLYEKGGRPKWPTINN